MYQWGGYPALKQGESDMVKKQKLKFQRENGNKCRRNNLKHSSLGTYGRDLVITDTDSDDEQEFRIGSDNWRMV